MPPRSPKMNRRILGFQRRVWWPKWTPASSSSRMVTADTRNPPDRLGVNFRRRRSGVPRCGTPPARRSSTGSRDVGNRPDDSGLERSGPPPGPPRDPAGSGAETSICSPVSGGRRRARRRAGTGARGRARGHGRRRGRRRPGGRSPPCGRGSGASGRSRASREGATAPGSASTSSKCVTASRGRSVSSDCARRVAPVAADRGLDPPRPRRRPPAHERDVGRAAIRRRRSWAWRRRSVSSSRATSRSPDVSRSSRWTMPARPGGPPPALPASAAASVGPE